MGLFSRGRGKGHHSEIADPAALVNGAVSIAEIVPRHRVVVVGQVTRMRARPASGEPSLVVTVTDDTGALTVVWTGRRAIGGVILGRHLAVEGVPRVIGHATGGGPSTGPGARSGPALEMTNPAYTLLP